MISIVLYGRNDNYGYNLHKRAALSLNCMAEVLTEPTDEILFVDYNTPDDYPTFPEAIQDTLTKRARKILRILRVRPRIHERFKSRTRLMALEPIARNVAVRRSSPSNRWILSTNTDMIFIPQRSSSLSGIVRGLAPGFYHAPRIEIPEALWESFDRQASSKVIRTVREWGTALHLNEIVLGSNFIRYDGPGDFQLLLRSDLFENHGFDEEMLLGWHVDSNIAARMLLKYKTVGDLGSHVFGYHCDHTRQVTPAHSHERVQNDWMRFVINIDSAPLPQQAETWGCAGDVIEEVRLAEDPASVYVQALREVIGDRQTVPNIVKYTGETYNTVDYDRRHLLPFLADMFVSMPRASNLGWYGARDETLQSFASIWEKLDFTGKILLATEEPAESPHDEHTTAAISQVSLAEQLAQADVFVFDFGGLPPAERKPGVLDPVSGELFRSFRRVVLEEWRRHAAGEARRRFIALNAINNEYESFVCSFLAAAATPFSTHMRHGFVLPPDKLWGNWLPILSIGEAGIRDGDHVKCDPKKLGWIAYGPFRWLEPGQYVLSLTVEVTTDEADRRQDAPCLLIEVAAGAELFGVFLLSLRQLQTSHHKVAFTVSQDFVSGVAGVETRMRSLIHADIRIRELKVEPASLEPAGSDIAAALTITDLLQADWLPFLRLGRLGRMDDLGISGELGQEDFVVFGPTWTLPPASYQMNAQFELLPASAPAEHSVSSDVLGGENQLATSTFSIEALPVAEKSEWPSLRLGFVVQPGWPRQRQIQTRVYSSGQRRFRIRSLTVGLADRQSRRDLFSLLITGSAGHRIGQEIRSVERHRGQLAYSPQTTLAPGPYRLSFQLQLHGRTATTEEMQTDAVVIAKQGSDVLAIANIHLGHDRAEQREFTFEIPSTSGSDGEFEVSINIVAPVDIGLRSLVVETTASHVRPAAPPVFEIEDWLPFLTTSSKASRDGEGVIVQQGSEGYALYGPNWTLPSGHYEIIASVLPPKGEGKPWVTVDVAVDEGRHLLAANRWRLGNIQNGEPSSAIELRLPFTVPVLSAEKFQKVETRIFTSGHASFRVCWLRVQRGSGEPDRARDIEKTSEVAAPAAPRDFLRLDNWLPFLSIGPSGRRVGRDVYTEPFKGFVVYGPYCQLPPGRYELSILVKRQPTAPDMDSPQGKGNECNHREVRAAFPYAGPRRRHVRWPTDRGHRPSSVQRHVKRISQNTAVLRDYGLRCGCRNTRANWGRRVCCLFAERQTDCVD